MVSLSGEKEKGTEALLTKGGKGDYGKKREVTENPANGTIGGRKDTGEKGREAVRTVPEKNDKSRMGGGKGGNLKVAGLSPSGFDLQRAGSRGCLGDSITRTGRGQKKMVGSRSTLRWSRRPMDKQGKAVAILGWRQSPPGLLRVGNLKIKSRPTRRENPQTCCMKKPTRKTCPQAKRGEGKKTGLKRLNQNP